MNRILTLRLWALLALALITACAGAADKATLRGPYLALATPSSMTIVWRTERAIAPVVRIGSSPLRLTRIIADAAIKARTDKTGGGDLSSAPAGAYQYEATINGLKPATKYYYAVYDGNRMIAGGDESYHFTTHPKMFSKKPFRFWVVGDSGTGDKNQADVHAAMRAYVAQQKRPLDFYLHVGDMAYNNGKDEEFQHNFFEPYDVTLRNTVCWPSMGNHEGGSSNGQTGVGPYYDAYVVPTRGEAGGLASGTEAYYSFDYANAHFICLDSHDLDRQPTGAMARWLKADLEATHAAWIIAFWHHPPYTKGTHDSDTEFQLKEMREHIMPILEAGGVDLVLTGHSHIYERSMLIDGAYGTPTVAENFVLDDGDGDPRGDGAYHKSAGLHPHEGSVQVVTGNGGAGMGRIGTMPVMKRIFVEHGSVIIDVAGDTLNAIMLNDQGQQRDLFSIVKRGKITPRRLAAPKQMADYIKVESLARMILPQLPQPGVQAPATVEIQKIPEGTMVAGATAKIEWDTTGTSWRIEPSTATLPLSLERAVQQEFSMSYTKELFPLPMAKITYVTGEDEPGTGDDEASERAAREKVVQLNIAIPPYRRATVPLMQAAPTIDGVLSEQEMAGLVHQTDFIAYKGTGPAQYPTEFYAGLYQGKLYLAVINHEPDMPKLHTVAREFDGPLYTDDSNEIFIQRAGSADYFQLIVNAMGQRYDSKKTDITWNGQWSTAMQRGTDRWVSESLISLDMLGQPLKPGDALRFNLVRNNAVHGEASQWSHTNRAGNHRPEYFGTLVVGGN